MKCDPLSVKNGAKFPKFNSKRKNCKGMKSYNKIYMSYVHFSFLTLPGDIALFRKLLIRKWLKKGKHNHAHKKLCGIWCDMTMDLATIKRG